MDSEQTEITERYIRELEWSDQATEHEKTLVAGNIRSFASGVMRPLIMVREHEKKMLREDLAAAREEVERLDAEREEAAGECLVPVPEVGSDAGKLLTANRLMAARIAELEAENKYLSEHHDATHDPAGRYRLLLDRLRGEPTDHGDCPVAAYLTELEAVVGKMTHELHRARTHNNAAYAVKAALAAAQAAQRGEG